MRLAALFVFMLALPIQAEEFRPVPPKSVGMDAEKLAEIDSLMQKNVENGRAVGCLALVVRNDKVAYFKMWTNH